MKPFHSLSKAYRNKKKKTQRQKQKQKQIERKTQIQTSERDTEGHFCKSPLSVPVEPSQWALEGESFAKVSACPSCEALT